MNGNELPDCIECGNYFVGGELSAYQDGLCSVMVVIALFVKVCNYIEN